MVSKITSALLFAAAAGQVAAQTSVVSIFLYNADVQPIVGSVVAANKAATTMALACPSGTDDSDCGIPSDMTVTYGATMIQQDYTMGEASMTAKISCSVSGTKTASCSGSISAAINTLGIQTTMEEVTTTTFTEGEITLMPITVTAGLDKLSAAATVTPTTTSSPSGMTTAVTSGTHGNTTSSGNGTSTSQPPAPGSASSLTLGLSFTGAVAALVVALAL